MVGWGCRYNPMFFHNILNIYSFHDLFKNRKKQKLSLLETFITFKELPEVPRKRNQFKSPNYYVVLVTF